MSIRRTAFEFRGASNTPNVCYRNLCDYAWKLRILRIITTLFCYAFSYTICMWRATNHRQLSFWGLALSLFIYLYGGCSSFKSIENIDR